MIDLLVKYALVALILLAMELGYFEVAKRMGIIDKPNMRSSHHQITLRGGGIIMLFAPWVWEIFFGFNYGWFIAGLTLVGIVSFVDDIHSLRNRYRLFSQFAAMAALLYGIGAISSTPWWCTVICLIVGVGIINAYNFMDGINGITGCYSLSILLPLLFLNYTIDFIDQSLLVVVAISVLIFLYFNFRKKAKCFAGDVGAISVAFFLLYAIGRLIMHTGDLTYILFLGVYGVDSILTIVHRLMLREHLGEAHRKHAYQLLSNELHMSHRSVSAAYMILQLIISFGLIACQSFQWIYFAAVCVILSIVYIMFMRRYYHLHQEYLNSLN